jgi:hypothetical protein
MKLVMRPSVSETLRAVACAAAGADKNGYKLATVNGKFSTIDRASAPFTCTEASASFNSELPGFDSGVKVRLEVKSDDFWLALVFATLALLVDAADVGVALELVPAVASVFESEVVVGAELEEELAVELESEVEGELAAEVESEPVVCVALESAPVTDAAPVFELAPEPGAPISNS